MTSGRSTKCMNGDKSDVEAALRSRQLDPSAFSIVPREHQGCCEVTGPKNVMEALIGAGEAFECPPLTG